VKKIFFPLILLTIFGCSPLKPSPQEARLELMLRELQTNLDDLRHGSNCFQTELQILDSRIKTYEHALAFFKQQDLDKWQEKISQIATQLQALEKRVSSLSHSQESEGEELQRLRIHANETSCALTQFKNRIVELELALQTKNRAVRDGLVHYKVRSGDTLDKIARLYKTTSDLIKQVNHLEQDLIVVGQELQIPTTP
jgi:LysM repeat protein